MEVLVVGAGEMGSWVTQVLHPQFEIAVTDQNRSRATTLAQAVDGRELPLDSDESTEIVCLAVPISAASAAIDQHAPRAEMAMFDITGVMREPIESMREALPARERASFHPLFSAANAPGNIAMVDDQVGPALRAICSVFETAGNDVFETDVAEHDTAMESVQASAHAAILAYAIAAEPVRSEFITPVSQTFEDLIDLVLSGAPQVYAEIQETFDGADAVAEAAANIAASNPTEIEKMYEELSEQY
ncbi:MAG: prephenate dehydrogenase [Haloquadratum sp. J07HQX50]|nr:MAG: prephenate dehydrogenase [Haloquadratum sp. J07HQX50]